MYSPEATPKRHKKHKRDKYEETTGGNKYESGGVSSVSSGNARLKLILKVGGSSTPEHSDSPGPAMSHVLNVPYDEDSNSTLSYAQIRKAKKKEKKKKKDKKHKHHKEKRRRDREELGMGMGGFLPISVVPIPMEQDSIEEGIGGEEDGPGPGGNMSNIGTMGLEREEEPGQGGLIPPVTGNDPTQHSLEPTCHPHSPATEDETRSGTGIGRETEGEGNSQLPPVLLKPKISKVFDKVSLQKLLDHLLKLIGKKDGHQVFAWPVTDKIAPGYSSIITKPMDLSKMRGKVERGEYETLHQFKDDFVLMCNNAMKYNHAETLYYKAAKKLLQSGSRILDPDKVRSLLPFLPFMRALEEEQLGFPLFLGGDFSHPIRGGGRGEVMSQSEEELPEPLPLDPTKSIHYVPPHPNDPPDLCGAFSEDATTEEILRQARLAAREAAHRLATKKPNAKMGFLRQREDGSTSLAILTPSNGVVPGTREQPVSLGLLTGKLPHGATQVQIPKEDKKNYARAAKPLNYGSFSSFAPNQDSTFAGLSPDEQELVQATYGDDTAVQYADSILEFGKGCDYAMRMVDQVLDTLTKGEHSRTVALIEERKKMEEEEDKLRRKQEAYEASIREEWKFVEGIGLPPSAPIQEETGRTEDGLIDFESLKTLGADLGIETKFIEELKPSCISSASGKLEETATLIESLEKMQKERLSQGSLPLPPYVQPPSENEVQLADRVTENLIQLVKQSIPGRIASEASLHQVMGIQLNAFNYMPLKEVDKRGE